MNLQSQHCVCEGCITNRVSILLLEQTREAGHEGQRYLTSVVQIHVRECIQSEVGAKLRQINNRRAEQSLSVTEVL